MSEDIVEPEECQSREASVQSEVDYILANSGDKVSALLGLLVVQVAAMVDALEGVQ